MNKAKLAFERKPDDFNATSYYKTREILESFYDNKTKGIVVIRALARWHENGEKSTKYFLNLQKRNHVKKTYKETEHKRYNRNRPKVHIDGQERFYRELYKSSYQIRMSLRTFPHSYVC